METKIAFNVICSVPESWGRGAGKVERTISLCPGSSPGLLIETRQAHTRIVLGTGNSLGLRTVARIGVVSLGTSVVRDHKGV